MATESSYPDTVLDQCPKCNSRQMEAGYGLFGVYSLCQTCRSRFEVDEAVQAWWFEGVPSEDPPATRRTAAGQIPAPVERADTLTVR